MKLTRKMIAVIAAIVLVIVTIAIFAVVGANQGWFFPDRKQFIEKTHKGFYFDIAKDYATIEEVRADQALLEQKWNETDKQTIPETAYSDYDDLREKMRRKESNFLFVEENLYSEEQLKNCFYFGCDTVRETVWWEWTIYQMKLDGDYSEDEISKNKAKYEKTATEWLLAQEAMHDYDDGKITIVQALNRKNADLEFLFRNPSSANFYTQPFERPADKALPSEK